MTEMLDLTPPNLLNQTSLPFRDAHSCKDWLTTLPLTDVPHAHNAMIKVIDSLNLTEVPGFERLKIMELLRDKVAFVQEAIAEVYAGQPLPISARRLDIWEASEKLWAGMEKGYRYCLRTAHADEETAKHIALIVERCLRYTGLQMLHHNLIYREPTPRLLQHLHALFHFSEKRGVAHVSVKDSLDGHRGFTTPAEIYIRTLLIDVARPAMLTANEMVAVDALLKKWASKIVISRIPPDRAPALLRCTDLAGDRGLWTPAEKPTEEASLIFLDLKELADSLRRRIRKLADGTPWGELRLPAIFGQVAAGTLLNHVYRCWCAPTRLESLVQPARELCEVSGNFLAFYHCLAGKPFEAPRQSDELDSLGIEQMAVFGKLMNRVSTEPVGEGAPTEPWKLEGVGVGRLLFRRPTSSGLPVSLQQLIAFHRATMPGYSFGMISGITDHMVSGLAVEVLAFAERPEAVIFRTKDTAFIPAFRMHRIEGGGEVSLLLPSGTYQNGKVVEVRDGTIHMYRLTGLKQHGTNFDWVSCELL